jgi:hypothetical protein
MQELGEHGVTGILAGIFGFKPDFIRAMSIKSLL